VGKPNSIVDRGLGVCILAHPTEYLWRVQLFGHEVEVLEAPVKGAVLDHRGGTLLTKMPASADKDRVRVTITCGNLLSVHTTYPL
jgi:hypothetical protein